MFTFGRRPTSGCELSFATIVHAREEDALEFAGVRPALGLEKKVDDLHLDRQRPHLDELDLVFGKVDWPICLGRRLGGMPEPTVSDPIRDLKSVEPTGTRVAAAVERQEFTFQRELLAGVLPLLRKMLSDHRSGRSAC